MTMMIGLTPLLAAMARAEPPPLPPPRPAAEAPAAEDGEAPAGTAHVLCGAAELQGESTPAIEGEGGCGIEAPIRLTAVGAVALDPPAVISCAMARALSGWLSAVALPAFAAVGTAPRALRVADAYSCRGRNGVAGAKLSEHGRGDAIDISAFTLRDGRTVTVLDGWETPDWGATLARLRQGACGPFSTVLGPGTNALHADHFHFDVEPRKRGPWCE